MSSSISGRDEHRGERGMAAIAGIERRLAHQAVHAGLGAQPAVGVLALDLDRRALDAGDFAGIRVDDLAAEAARGAPAQIHAQQHLRPVLRLGAAGAGLDVEEGAVRVHLAAEHALAARGGAPAARGAARRARCRARLASSSSLSASSSSSAASAMPLVARSISLDLARQPRALAPELLRPLRLRPDSSGSSSSRPTSSRRSFLCRTQRNPRKESMRSPRSLSWRLS